MAHLVVYVAVEEGPREVPQTGGGEERRTAVYRYTGDDL